MLGALYEVQSRVCEVLPSLYRAFTHGTQTYNGLVSKMILSSRILVPTHPHSGPGIPTSEALEPGCHALSLSHSGHLCQVAAELSLFRTLLGTLRDHNTCWASLATEALQSSALRLACFGVYLLTIRPMTPFP